MKAKTHLLLIACLAAAQAMGQTDSLQLTLSEAIRLAQEQSSDALAARHSLEAAEWSYRYHQANYLPSVTLSSAPSLNRQMNSITQPNGTSLFGYNHLRWAKRTEPMRYQIARNLYRETMVFLMTDLG